jgi:flagella basal body P-ring formation protein FlgA
MKCFSRLTPWLVSVMLTGPGLAFGQRPSAPTGPADAPAIRLALIEAIRGRLGPTAHVRLERVSISLDVNDATVGLVAVPEPGSRIGCEMRFALLTDDTRSRRGGTRRIGQARAAVYVAIEHVRAAGAIGRGATVTDADLVVSDDEVGISPLVPLPLAKDIAGGRAIRDLRTGDVLTSSLVKAQPLVRSGDTVNVRFHLGPVEATGKAVAQQSGYRHDRIKLINPDSRRTMVGRVVGAGEVEVLYES